MAIPFKKYGYKLDPATREFEAPQVFLVDKKLHKKGMLSPIENLRIKVNEVNNADEISFTYYKEVNGKKCWCFDELDDLSVIEVEGYGFFECQVSKNENASISKNVVGQSLGYSELSQILGTLEINTADDMARADYDEKYPTVLYRKIPVEANEEAVKKLRESSLLHRILTYAPHYKIGHVDETLRQIQRTFSWSDTDLVSIFNDVSQEINCVFDIQVRIGEDGNAERVINVYDMQYCEKCWDEIKESGQIASPSQYRNIVTGVSGNCVCENCGESSHIKGVGEDTGIYISTRHLSDDITIEGDKDSIKNCFKIVGGDDVITNTVQGLSMASSGKIMQFSDLQKKNMSAELLAKLEQYDKDYKDNISDYEKLLETEYGIYDMKLYLQSGKMPQIEKEITTTDGALYSVLEKISTYYNNKFYISIYKDYSSIAAKSSIRNMFTTFMPEGYSFMVDTDDITGYGGEYSESTTYQWSGKIKVYSTGNRSDYYVLHVKKGETTYVTHLDDERVTSDNYQSLVDEFSVIFTFADKKQSEYRGYLEQHTKYILSTVDLSYENEKKQNWNEFCYNRLESFYDGYQTCIDSLQNMMYESEKDTAPYKILTDLIENYTSIQNDIHKQMLALQDQIFALCSYLGSYDDDFINDVGDVIYPLQHYTNIDTIFENIINPSCTGGYNSSGKYTVNEFIGSKPFKCKKCGSTNVSVSTTGNVCNNPGCGGKDTDIYTYLDIMKDISESYNEHKNDTIISMRTEYQKRFETKTYFGEELYTELLSYIREDIYTNDNFTSDGLTNAEIIEQAKELKAKAEQELAKACQIQYTITTSLSSLLGQKEFTYRGVVIPDDYDGFKIGNYVRVDIDDIIYKMRVASINIVFPVEDKIEVTFTNVTSHNEGIMSDIKSILDSAASMATTYDYVATQAEKGAAANTQFDTIKREGLDAGLMAVKAGQNQDVVIDNHGILLRKKNEETDEYSDYQMKLINRNIVMTDDNWKTARMAIGLGMYDKQLVYGVWADVLVGDIIAGKELKIRNEDENKQSTVTIDENGIGIQNGYLHIQKGRYSIEIDPNNISTATNDNFMFAIRDNLITEVPDKPNNSVIMGVDNNGKGYFDGDVIGSGGKLGDFILNKNSISSQSGNIEISSDNNDIQLHHTIDEGNTKHITINHMGMKIYDDADTGLMDLTTSHLLLSNNSEVVEIAPDRTLGIFHAITLQPSSNLTLSTTATKFPGYNLVAGSEHSNYFDYSSSSGDITIKKTGTYLVSAQVYFTDGFTVNDIAHVFLYRNNTPITETQDRFYIANPYTCIALAPYTIFCSAGDKLSIRCYNQSGARGNIGANKTHVTIDQR